MKKIPFIGLMAIIILTLTCVFVISACEENQVDTNGDLNEPNFEIVYAYAQEAGFTGTMEELVELFKGDSAYELACKGGYTGTEKEWLDSLIGASGKDGKDGVMPSIGENGNWHIAGIDTGVSATGKDGNGIDRIEKSEENSTLEYDYYYVYFTNGTNTFFQVRKGTDGKAGETGNGIVKVELSFTNGLVDEYTIYFTDDTTFSYQIRNGKSAYDLAVENGYEGTLQEWLQSLVGKDGHTPIITIGGNGDWYIDGVDSNVKAQGDQGEQGIQGEVGPQGPQGEQGIQGEAGHTPVITIGENGNWYVDGVDTGVKAEYVIEKVTVTFHTNGGTFDNSSGLYVQVEENYTIELNKGDAIAYLPMVITAKGYDFEGWRTGTNVTDGYWTNGLTISCDLDLYAVIEKNHNCYDKDDHICDICEETITSCVNKNRDHICDICGTLLGDCTDDDDSYYCDVCGKKLPGAVVDAFEGKWTKVDASKNYYQYTLEFNGGGMVTIHIVKYNTTYTADYIVNDNVATFYTNWADWTCTLNEDGTLQVIDMDMDGVCTVNIAMDKVVEGGEEDPEVTLDAFAGTYTYSSFTLTFDGQGNGVYNNGSDWNFTYDVNNGRANISNFAAYDDGENYATLTETGVDIHFSGCYGDDVFNASFVKQESSEGGEEEPETPVEPEEPEVTLDAFAGTYTYSSFILTFDGQGNGVYNNGSDWTFTYTVYADTASISSFAAYDDGENSATLTETGVDVHFSGSYGDDVFNASFVKQESTEEETATLVTIYFKSENGWTNANIYAWVTGGATITESWPGTAMTDLGDGWFSYTFAEDVVPTNIIFNNGTAQTADLTFDGTNNYYAFNTMTGGVWGADDTVSAPVAESDCYLRGNVAVGETDWAIGKPMTYNGMDEYSITITVDAGAAVKVYHAPDNVWVGSESLKDGITIEIEKSIDGHIVFTNAGTYTIYYKASGDNIGIWIAEVSAE